VNSEDSKFYKTLKLLEKHSADVFSRIYFNDKNQLVIENFKWKS